MIEQGGLHSELTYSGKIQNKPQIVLRLQRTFLLALTSSERHNCPRTWSSCFNPSWDENPLGSFLLLGHSRERYLDKQSEKGR